ncbi:hypothetical protein M885DRAFT_514854 [Pelagophyceae sp. CCMP2097]|nr:hypothetical protein M885DRAFT_514854 [Pelagophyceae sp. CCMP2097]
MEGTTGREPHVPGHVPGTRRKQLRSLIRRQIDKVKVRTLRSPRSAPQKQDADTDEEEPAAAPQKQKLRRLERSIKKQLARGKTARRKLQDLQYTIRAAKDRISGSSAPVRRGRADADAGYSSDTAARGALSSIRRDSPRSAPRFTEIVPPMPLTPEIGVRNILPESRRRPGPPERESFVGSPVGGSPVPRGKAAPFDLGPPADSGDEGDDADDADDASESSADEDEDEEDDDARSLDEDVLNLLRSSGKPADRLQARASRGTRRMLWATATYTAALATLVLVLVDAASRTDAPRASAAAHVGGVLTLQRAILCAALASAALHAHAIWRAAVYMSALLLASVVKTKKGKRLALKRAARTKRKGSLGSIEDDSDDDDATLGPPPRPLQPQLSQRSFARLRLMDEAAKVPSWTIPLVDAAASGAGNSWSALDAAHFQLRSATYLADGKKAASAPAIYDCIAVHVFQSRGGAMDDVFALRPDLAADLAADRALPDVGLPSVLVLNMAVPTEAPSITGWRAGSPCWVIAIVLRLSDASRAQLLAARSAGDLAPGVRLLQLWLATAAKDPYMNSRLKGLFFCHPGVSEAADKPAELPRIMQKWNGKPVLMAANARGFGGRPGISKLRRGVGYTEIGVSVGDSFSYVGRGAVYIMIAKLAALACDVCFTLEGRDADELPEAVIACCTFSKLKLHEKFKTLTPF